MPLIAATATKSISDILVCTSSPEPNCDQVLCTIFSNNDTLEFRVLPCNDPPGIQLINRNISGDVRFNQTFTSTVNNVTAPIGSNPAVLNVTIVQHTEMLTLGVMVRRNEISFGRLHLKYLVSVSTALEFNDRQAKVTLAIKILIY